MKSKHSALICLLILLLVFPLLLSACQPPQVDVPRQDATLFVPPAGPTLTPTATPTPEPASYMTLGAEGTLAENFLGYQPLTAWNPEARPFQSLQGEDSLSLMNSEGTLFYHLAAPQAGESKSTQDCLDRILQRMPADVQGLATSPVLPVSLASMEALETNFSGVIGSERVSGLLSVTLQQQHCISLLGYASGANADALWKESGVLAYQKMAGTLRLNPEAAPTADTCAISTDQFYGRTKDTPIPIGNINLYDGKQREELYLLTLRGPGNEEILFTRQQPRYNSAGTIVDAYEITYQGLENPIMIYFDIYHFETPQAIMGFTCEASFPISPP